MARIGIYGGTFDPIHHAHLIVAENAREQLKLDRVLLVPAANPPHKRNLGISTDKLRLEMVKLATAGNTQLEACDIELERGGISFTVDTLRQLKESNPDDRLFLIIGADTLTDLPNWREPAEILKLVSLVVAHRPGTDAVDFGAIGPLIDDMPRDDSIIEMPLVEISSSDLRDRVSKGRSIRYLVPPAVEAFIHAHEMYRSER